MGLKHVHKIGSDVWFTFTAPSDGSWRISLCAGTNYDAALAVYPGSVSCPPTDNDVLTCNDDGCFGAGPPIAIISLNSGEQILLQVGGWSSAAGIGEIVIDDVPPLPAGADILIGEISNFVQFGRLADEIGCGIESVTCNAGAEPLDWFGNPDPRHPFITTAAYRLENGRFYQIGMSWAKHGFAAAQTNACNLGCSPFPNGTRLGSGCSDVYGASTNAAQQFLGPRSEINPWTGAYEYSTSILSSTSGPYDPIERRLRIQDRDVDPSMHPGAEYFCEVLVLAHDDVDHLNSVAWQPISVSPMSPSGVFTFDTAATSTLGPAIFAWPDATIVEVLEPTAQDGRVFVGHRAIELGDDLWRYEYAIQNLDLNSGIGSFEIPVPAGVTVSNLQFHAPNQHEPNFADEPWQGTRQTDSVRWETNPIGSPALTNPISWGALYNFSFTADSPPESVTAILETYDPSILTSMSADVVSPLAPPLVESFRRGDINADGLYDVADVIAGLQCLFFCFPACLDAHDVNDDGQWDIADPIYELDYLFSGGPSPAAPFPECGEDLTADALDCQSYQCP